MENVVRYPSASYQENLIVHKIYQVALHTFPAYCLDILAFLTGGKRGMVNMVGKIHAAQKVTEYYLAREWHWETDNVEKLHKELSDADRKIFNFDLTTLNWEEYIGDYVKGTRKYIFKENEDTLEEARTHANKMYWIEKFIQMFFLVLLFQMFSWI